MSDEELTGTPPEDAESEDDSSVLEMFGLELKVRNKRLAEVLRMDAKEALGTDVRDLLDPNEFRSVTEEAAEAMPDVVVHPASPHDEDEARRRTELRERVNAVGVKLGFNVSADGVWRSPSGIAVMTRVVVRTLTAAAAADLVIKVEAHRSAATGPDSSALYVTHERADVASLSQAISERDAFDRARVVCLEDLEFMLSLASASVIDHRSAVALLVPIVDADVGEILRIVRAAAG